MDSACQCPIVSPSPPFFCRLDRFCRCCLCGTSFAAYSKPICHTHPSNPPPGCVSLPITSPRATAGESPHFTSAARRRPSSAAAAGVPGSTAVKSRKQGGRESVSQSVARPDHDRNGIGGRGGQKQEHTTCTCTLIRRRLPQNDPTPPNELQRKPCVHYIHDITPHPTPHLAQYIPFISVLETR
jgi:hypothetical protein